MYRVCRCAQWWVSSGWLAWRIGGTAEQLGVLAGASYLAKVVRSTMATRLRWGSTAALLTLLLGAACLRDNADHCDNRRGSATCLELGLGSYCSVCTAERSGCVDLEPNESCRSGALTETEATTSADADAESTEDSGSEMTEDTGGESTQGGPDCGNGMRDEGEVCDGPDLDGKNCSDFGFGGGTLSCDAMCNFDLGACCYVQGESCGLVGDQCCGGLSCLLDKCG